MVRVLVGVKRVIDYAIKVCMLLPYIIEFTIHIIQLDDVRLRPIDNAHIIWLSCLLFASFIEATEAIRLQFLPSDFFFLLN